MRQIQYPQILQCRSPLNPRYSIVVQVQYLQFGEFVYPANPNDLVFWQQQYLKCWQRQIFHFLYQIVVQVNIKKVWKRYQVLYFMNFVMLKCYHLQFLLSLQQWHMRQV